MKITAPGIKWKCFFGSHVPACIEALRAVCTNAVFIDVAGQEYLPTKTYDPHTVLRNLVRTRLRRATAFLLVAIPCLVWGAIVIIAIIVGFNKGATPTDILSEVNIGFFIVPVLGLFSLTAAITQFRKAKSLSKRIKTELAQGMDDTVLGHAIDLSQSGIERM